MIIKSTHTFAPGVADSDIEAKWVNKIYDANDEVSDIFVKAAQELDYNFNPDFTSFTIS